MRQILGSLFIALLFTACGSDDKEQEKQFNTDKKVETKSETQNELKEMEQLEKKIATVAKEPQKAVTPPTKKVAEATEKLAKNIFELSTIEGKKLHVDEALNGITFQEHKDKIVLLIFFGYRCPPCLKEIPAITKLVAEKGDKLAVIGMEVQRLPEAQLKTFTQSKGINYTILSGENSQNSKFISYISERTRWTGSIPFLVGIATNGEVGVVHVGGMGLGEFKTVFDNLEKQSKQ